MMAEYFIRNLEFRRGILEIYQEWEGDVGCVVWDAAIALSKYLDTKSFDDRHHTMENRKVIELGSGTGIVGLTAALNGASVVVSDLPELVPLLEKNIEHNKDKFKQGHIKALSLKWGEDTSNFLPHPDFILMADLIYYDESTEPLVDTICSLSSENTTVLMSYEVRTSHHKVELQKRFFELSGKYFEIETIPLEMQDPVYRSEDIHILEMRKKRS